MDSRAEFEAWALAASLSIWRDAAGDYLSAFTHLAWKSWQASRAACAKVCDDLAQQHTKYGAKALEEAAREIRRGKA